MVAELRDKRLLTALHCAAQSGNNKVIKSLLTAGCQPNARGHAGATPLHSAVSRISYIDLTTLELLILIRTLGVGINWKELLFSVHL